MKRPRKTSPAPVIAFPLPSYDDTAPDIRWERVEALYREISRLDPEWFTHDRGNSSFRLIMEQTFCHHLLSKLMAHWTIDARVQLATMCQRIQHEDHERYRQEDAARVRAGQLPRFSFLEPAAELENLIIRLQRRVEDLRREHARRGAR